jgi:hypothetical protein
MLILLERAINTADYLTIYREGGLEKLNSALVGLSQVKLVYVLRELEAHGFTAMTFSDDDILVPRHRGILIDGP